MSQALYRKWRPARFADVVGQEHITRTLQNAVASERVGHAYLFCGPRGTGKTTTARLLAKAVNCLHDDLVERPDDACHICKAINENRFLDLIEIDAASNTGVDDIRDLRDKINFSPSEGRFKVYIIDEVHMLSTAAFNALLKTLEEPPAHAMFVLATTEEHKVPMTIKSRCQQFNFRLLTQAEIEQRLNWLAEKESLKIEPEALSLVAQHGAGSLRDAESLLDQLVVAPNETITLERTQQVLGTASTESVVGLTQAIMAQDGATGLQVLHTALSTGADARQLARQLVNFLRQLLLLKTSAALPLNLPKKQIKEMKELAERFNRPLLIQAIKNFNDAAMSNSSSWQPQLPLELAFVELLNTPQTQAQPVMATPAPPVATPAPVAKPKAKPAAKKKAAPPPPPKQVEKKPEAKAEAKPVKVEEPIAKAPPAPVGDGTLTLDLVMGNWPKLMVTVREKDKNLQSLLAMTKPLAVEANTLVLGFEYPILRDKFRDNAVGVEAVAEALSEMSGTKSAVRAVLTGEYALPEQPADSPIDSPAPVKAEKTATPKPPPPASNPDIPPMPEEPPEESDEDIRAQFEALADELGGIVGDSK